MMKIVRGSFHKINKHLVYKYRAAPITPTPPLLKSLAIFNLLHFTFFVQNILDLSTQLLSVQGVQARCGKLKQQCRVSLFITGRDTEGDCRDYTNWLCSVQFMPVWSLGGILCVTVLDRLVYTVYQSLLAVASQFFLYIQTEK